MNNFISKILLAAAPIILASAAPASAAKPAQDYTKGNALWFDTPNPSDRGVAIWNIDNGHAESANPDTIWERCSFPIGNGSFGGNVIGSVARERVVLNEKSLWKGGPAAGLKDYWNMNRQVPDSVLSKVRTLLEQGRNAEAGALVSENYRGNVPYTPDLFGTFTVLGEAYVTTGIPDDAVTDYRRILNLDNSLAVVKFNHKGSRYQRRYFTSYPDSVMVWRFTSSSAPQTLVFSFATPQELKATNAAKGGLLYTGTIDNNGMKWALRVMARTADRRGTVKADPAAGTITVTGSRDVEFILAADTDYRMNFNPDTTDPKTYTGGDPVRIVNSEIDAAAAMPYAKLYDRHLADYKALYDRVDLEINPGQTFPNLPTPQRLANYRNGVLDHDLERMHFQYGRYLLISSSRPGNLPAHLQGLWHNNVYGPWRMDYHNNINVQMNYWPATSTNLMECFEPYTDYIRSLVKPGEVTARDYYGARGWTAAISANPFGFTAPLNSTDMSWNYNPSAGPWLATQIWEYYDYTRDRKWLREIGYPIIKASANFAADLLTLSDGEYTVSPSYSPEHGGCDRGTTYANAVTREILTDAIKAARILDTDPQSVKEWEEKLARIRPYKIGKHGQLQEWYEDIDNPNDHHRHTNHLFGLHPGSTIDPLHNPELAEACKTTLRQRGDEATGWSMGWKLNHWARLHDGDHAYTLFQNLLKEGTTNNLWDIHPPFQIDGNFGGTAGVAELFLQSHTGPLQLLPALPSAWTDGHIHGLRARGNFTVDIDYAGGKLTKAVITSGSGEPCEVIYQGQTIDFPTRAGGRYTVTLTPAGTLKVK